jgi:hypothetical protein
MNKAEQRHHDIVRSLDCVICREYLNQRTPASVHHIAEGSGQRSEWLVAPLCYDHHQGAGGFHDGPKTFLRVYKLATEYHLLGLVNKFRAEDGV